MRRTSPASPTSPIATVPGASGWSVTRAGDGQREREVAGRLERAARRRRWRRRRPGPPSGSPARRSSTASTIATRLPSTPDVARRGSGCPAPARPGACTSLTSGRRPSSVTVTQVPGTGSAWRERNRPLGSGRPTMPASDRSKQPTSSVGPVPVLDRPQHAQPRVPVALELADDVHQVLQHPRPGDRAVLRHVPDEHGGHAALLRHPDEGRRDLAHLGDVAGRAVDRVAGDGLHRVDDQQVGRRLLDVPEHRAEVGLRGDEQPRPQRADALGAQPHLAGGLLAGDVEHRAALLGGAGRDVEQQRRLADARLAGQQDDGARDEPAAEHPVELLDAGRPGQRRCRPSTSAIGSAPRGADPRPRDAGDGRDGLRRPSPTPGTRRSGRPT